MFKKLIAWTCVFFMLVACAPKEFTPYTPENLVFEKTPYYELDLSKLGDIPDLIPIYVDENFKEVDVSKAKYAVLIPEEYKKIAIMKKAVLTNRKVAFEQAKLINTNVEIINGLKEYAMLERQKTQAYRELWVNSENNYRQEAYNRKMDDLQNKAVWGLVIIGTAIVLALTL